MGKPKQATLQIDFSRREGAIIEKFKHRYGINNKKEAVKRMVDELNEKVYGKEEKKGQ